MLNRAFITFEIEKIKNGIVDFVLKVYLTCQIIGSNDRLV